jgi:hypothetical protein
MLFCVTVAGVVGGFLTIGFGPKRLGATESEIFIAPLVGVDVPWHPWWWQELTASNAKRAVHAIQEAGIVICSLSVLVIAMFLNAGVQSRNVLLQGIVISVVLGFVAVFVVRCAREERFDAFQQALRQAASLTASGTVLTRDHLLATRQQTGRDRCLARLTRRGVTLWVKFALATLVILAVAVGVAHGDAEPAVIALTAMAWKMIDETSGDGRRDP